MMGVMTLALSIFSIIPMAIFLVYRLFMARVVTRLVQQYSTDPSGKKYNGVAVNSVAFWGTVFGSGDNDGISNEETLPPEDSPEVVWLAYSMLIFFIVSLILLSIYAIASILLIYGSVKGRRWFLVPWLICTLAFILVYLVGMCLSLWLIGVHVLSLIFFFIALVEVCIAIYLWFCIISLHQALGDDTFTRRDDWRIKPKFSTRYRGVDDY